MYIDTKFLMIILLLCGFIFLLQGARKGRIRKAQNRMDKYIHSGFGYLQQEQKTLQNLAKRDPVAYRQAKYINDWSGYPIYQNTETKYYKCGEDMFPDMLVELEKANHYIFLEYFIIEEGYLFQQIREILERKAKNGVEVRIIYDDAGNITTLPAKYYKILEKKGIKCTSFHPFRLFLSEFINHRDHRKIMVIDGNVGFTGGMNLADEYINQKERYGYWKDTGIRLKGDAVKSLTIMFLSMWDFIHEKFEDYSMFQPNAKKFDRVSFDGYVQPYGDCPLCKENICETVYLNIINQAIEYLYIFTPYLIINKQMLLALGNAAKRGVDVRIVTPGVPDKRMIYLLTQSYYLTLLKSGVKIYHYRPGFLHAKSFLCDDKIATIGSVNLDYRSLYLQFECGVYMVQTKAVMQLKQDSEDVFSVSDEITIEFCKNQKLLIKILQIAMKFIAPFC